MLKQRFALKESVLSHTGLAGSSFDGHAPGERLFLQASLHKSTVVSRELSGSSWPTVARSCYHCLLAESIAYHYINIYYGDRSSRQGPPMRLKSTVN